MLYTITPLERVYTDQNNVNEENILTDRCSEKEELKTIPLTHGKIYVKKSGDHYVVDGIHSTDMSDYLKKEYSPGEKYSTKE